MGIFTMLGVLLAPAQAATVSLTPGSTLTSVGSTVILNIERSDFTDNADGGAFQATWDSTILQLVSVSITSPDFSIGALSF